MPSAGAGVSRRAYRQLTQRDALPYRRLCGSLLFLHLLKLAVVLACYFLFLFLCLLLPVSLLVRVRSGPVAPPRFGSPRGALLAVRLAVAVGLLLHLADAVAPALANGGLGGAVETEQGAQARHLGVVARVAHAVHPRHGTVLEQELAADLAHVAAGEGLGALAQRLDDAADGHGEDAPLHVVGLARAQVERARHAEHVVQAPRRVRVNGERAGRRVDVVVD